MLIFAYFFYQGSSPFGSGENLCKHLSDYSRPDDATGLSVGGYIHLHFLKFFLLIDFSSEM